MSIPTITAGATPSIVDLVGDTPLIRAVHHRDNAMVALLLEHDANPNVKGAFDVTPLMEATANHDTMIASRLKAAGALK